MLVFGLVPYRNHYEIESFCLFLPGYFKSSIGASIVTSASLEFRVSGFEFWAWASILN